MKKYAAAILALIFILIPLSVFAEEQAPAETQIMMGDVTNDRKISASDARKVLRMAAGLESTDGISMLSADADGNGKITAADARIILRVSAHLSDFSCGFDADGNPNAVNVIKGGVYILEISVNDGTGEMPIMMAFDGKNSCLKYAGSFENADGSDGQFDSGNDDGEEMFTISDIGALFLDGKMYALATMNNVKLAITEDSLVAFFSDEDDILEDFSELIGMVDFLDSLIPDEAGIPQKVTKDGEECFVYTYTVLEQQIQMTVNSRGKLIKLETGSDSGSDIEISINSISKDIPSDIFTLDGYVLF